MCPVSNNIDKLPAVQEAPPAGQALCVVCASSLLLRPLPSYLSAHLQVTKLTRDCPQDGCRI